MNTVKNAVPNAVPNAVKNAAPTRPDPTRPVVLVLRRSFGVCGYLCIASSGRSQRRQATDAMPKTATR